MGLIIGRFRKKKTTYEILEKLENDIKNIEEFRRNTEQTQKKMVGRFVFISICVYLITALIFYFYFFPASVYERIVYIIPLLILPILLIVVKRILTWYYNRKLVKNQKKLSTLKDEKKQILEDVMDKETYKVAQKILEKFAPEQVRRTTNIAESTPVKGSSGPVVPATGLRYRGYGMTPAVRPYPSTPVSRAMLPQPPPPPPTPLTTTIGTVAIARPAIVANTPLPLPRSILPKDRTFLDKMVDYLVGDGPSNRYALICKNCSSHNGMALKEEFDYLAFRCCYCLTFNPARKQRPIAPKLETSSPAKNRLQQNVSDSEDTSGDCDSETETGPIITEPPNDSPEQQRSQSETLQQDDDINEDEPIESDGTVDEVDNVTDGSTEEKEEENKIETVEEIIQTAPYMDDSNDEQETELLRERTQKD